MRIVVASAHDEPARALAARWRAAGHQAGVLTPADLSVAGWRHDPQNEVDGRAVVEGEVIATRGISAVVTRLMAVPPAELDRVAPGDRPYAAAEMHAFLVAWLASLRCPVLNRPWPGNLAGRPWSPEVWRHRARGLGIPTQTSRRRAVMDMDRRESRPDAGELFFVDVVGERCVPPPGIPADADACRHALTLAGDADMQLLRAAFLGSPGSASFVEASHWIDLSAPAVAGALDDRLGAHEVAPPRVRAVETQVAFA